MPVLKEKLMYFSDKIIPLDSGKERKINYYCFNDKAFF